MKMIALALAAALTAGAAAANAAPAPNLGLSSLNQLSTPLPYPYDEHADADAAVEAARARAAAHGKLLLIDLGGNWCPDCRILAAIMALPAMKSFLAAHYEVVTVDVGRFDKNLQIPARFGVRSRLDGVPSVLIVDPRTSALLDAGHIAALADARSMNPQAIADWLARWTL